MCVAALVGPGGKKRAHTVTNHAKSTSSTILIHLSPPRLKKKMLRKEDAARSDRKGHFFLLTRSLTAAEAVFEMGSLQLVLQLTQDHRPIKNSNYPWIPLGKKRWLLFLYLLLLFFFVRMVVLWLHKIFPPFFSGEESLLLKGEGQTGPWQNSYFYLKGRALCMDAHLLCCSNNISSLTWRESKQKGQGKHSILHFK